MPSPDQSGYTTLTLYDKGPFELMAKALQDAAAKTPDWEPRVGALEYVHLEALALPISEEIYAINRLPNGIMEILMSLFGIVRDLGVPPMATATFVVSDTTGHEIPAGTVVRLNQSGEDPVEFATDEGLAIAPGDTMGTVAITGTTNTTAANGAVIGTILEMVTVVSYVDQVTLATVPSGGASTETDDEWRDRAVGRIGRFTDTLVLPTHFNARALEDPSVGRAFTKDNWNVSTTAAGHVTTAVADLDGNALSGPAMTALQTAMSAQAMAGLGVHIVEPDYTEVEVHATVTALASADPTELETACTEALESYLSPQLWPWGSTVRLNEIISLLDRVEGVDWVGAVTLSDGGSFTAADLALTGDFPLVSSGTHDITVA